MKIKQIISIFLSVFLMVSMMIVPVTAENYSVGTASPMYDSVQCNETKLEISETKATCFSTAYGDNITKITALQSLEKYWGLWIWNTVEGSRVTKTVNSSKITLSNTVSGLSSGKYRAKTVFTFTDSNGNEEKVTVYSSTRTV